MLKLTPPIWAMIFLAVAAVVSWGLGFPALPWPPHHAAVGMAIFFTAWIAPVWAFVIFRRAGTEVDPISETNRVLVTRGPYRFSRNPMYLGLIAASVGMAIWAGWPPMLAAPFCAFATVKFVHIPFEEAKLRRQYVAAHDVYAARVRRWL